MSIRECCESWFPKNNKLNSQINITIAPVALLYLWISINCRRIRNCDYFFFSEPREMSKGLLCALLISQCLLVFGAEYYTTLYNAQSKQYAIKEGYIKSADAASWAYYADVVDETGWAFLTISTNQAQPDEVQAYAAGFVVCRVISY